MVLVIATMVESFTAQSDCLVLSKLFIKMNMMANTTTVDKIEAISAIQSRNDRVSECWDAN